MPGTVAIIGAGPLGRWLALSAARAGFRVLLEDVMPANLHHAQEFLRQQLGPQVFPKRDAAGSGGQAAGSSTAVAAARSAQDERGRSRVVVSQVPKAGPGAPSSCGTTGAGSLFDVTCRASRAAQDVNVAGVDFVSTIEDAVRDADLAIDCVPDELESKLEIFWLLDRMAPPRTVLVTPTTRLSIADLANCTYRPAQCIAIAQEASSLAAGASKEILLRTTTRTAPETVALVRDFWQRLGFIPTFEPDPAEPPAH